MKKKIFAILLVVAMVAALAVGLTACNKGNKTEEVKIGVICLHDENSTYDKNFIDAIKAVKKELGLKDSQVIIKTGIPEDNECYETAADLVDQGCNIIFADSFGHEASMIKAAKEFKDVQFCHATGTRAHTEGLTNYHNAFASIYEGRYLAGIAAGMKLNAMAVAANTAVDGKATGANAKMGYVGAYTYAEVVSGLTSFYLGAKSVCPDVTMDVKFTGSWYDPDAEKTAAEDLITNQNCKLISQHADSMGAPNACKAAGVPNVTYNISTKDSCDTTYLAGSKIDWAPYFKYILTQVKDGKAIDTDWTGTIATGSVKVLEINTAVAAAGTQAAIDAAIEAFKAGTLNVFDTATFTVEGATKTSYQANVNFNADSKGQDDNTPDTEVIANGIFQESKFRSAPYFDIKIDGINFLNTKF